MGGDALEAVHQWYMLEGAVLKPPRYLQEPSSESDAWQQIGPEAQIGTANFYDPTASVRIAAALPDAITSLGANRVAEVVGTLALRG